MLPKKLPNGNLLVPQRFIDETTGLCLDKLGEIGPDDPDFKRWMKWIDEDPMGLMQDQEDG